MTSFCTRQPGRREVSLWYGLLVWLFCSFFPEETAAQAVVPDSASQAVTFIPDRPGIADSPYTVPVKSVQVETGLEYFNRLTAHYTYLPAVQARIGLTRMLELRTTVRYQLLDSLPGDLPAVAATLAPVVVGAKIHLLDETGAIPDIALLTNLTIPYLTKDEVRPRHVGHEILLLFQNNLSEKFSLNYNVGGLWDGNETAPVWLLAATVGYQLHPQIGLFAEPSMYIPAHEAAEWGLDAGVTFLPNAVCQLDLSGGFSRANARKYFFISAGGSFLLTRPKNR